MAARAGRRGRAGGRLARLVGRGVDLARGGRPAGVGQRASRSRSAGGGRAASSARGASELGLRVERRRTGYTIAPDSGAASYGLASTTPIATVFGRHERPLGGRVELELGVAVVAGAGAARMDPGAKLRWRVDDRLVLTGGYARRHQLTQSLRNPESIVGNVFPAELPVGAGASGVPVARSDQGVIGAELRASAGVRIAAQAWVRGFDGLLLAARATGEPFAVAGFATGTGAGAGRLGRDVACRRAIRRARELCVSAGPPRFGRAPATSPRSRARTWWTPASSSSRRPRWRSGWPARVAAGRRGTTIPDGVEWESCNLRDKGCELAGSPHYDGAALGGSPAPALCDAWTSACGSTGISARRTRRGRSACSVRSPTCSAAPTC